MQYIMVMVEVDSNVILVEPIKNCTSNELECVYFVLLNCIKAAWIVPQKHVLDNEYSDNMKKLIHKTCRLRLVQPYCHRYNVAEVAIKNSKRTSSPSLQESTTIFPYVYGTSCFCKQRSLSIDCVRQTSTQSYHHAHTSSAILTTTVYHWHRWSAPYRSTFRPNAAHHGASVHARDGTLDALGSTTAYTRTLTT